jgi:hypothetical protein
MHMDVPYTTPLKDTSQSSFVYAGKIKVRSFLNSMKVFFFFSLNAILTHLLIGMLFNVNSELMLLAVAV